MLSKGVLAITLLPLLALTTVPAAATTYDFSFSDAAGDSAAGQIMTTGSGPNYTITGITGTFDGETITGLDPTYASADNILYSAGPYLSEGGVSFDLTGGPATQVNVFYGDAAGVNGFTGTGYFLDINPPDAAGSGPDAGPLVQGNFVVAAVPEPSTWAMMILGFCGLGFMAYRRKQNDSSFRVA